MVSYNVPKVLYQMFITCIKKSHILWVATTGWNWVAIWMLTDYTPIISQHSKLCVKYRNSNKSKINLTGIMNQEHHGPSWMMLICFLNFKMRQAKVGMNINLLLLLYLLISLSILYPRANCLPAATLFPCCLSMTLHILHHVQQWFHQKLFVQTFSGEFRVSWQHTEKFRANPTW